MRGRLTAAVILLSAPAAPGSGSGVALYADPKRWHDPAAYGRGNDECRHSRQSPIELRDDTSIRAGGPPEFLKLWSPRQQAPPVKLSNNGHTIQLDAEQLGITLTGGHIWSQYKLVQIHYHSPSEHTIDGERYPLERHMVFFPSDYKELRDGGQVRFPFVVFGELYNEGTEGDRTIAQLVDGGLTSALADGESINVPLNVRVDFGHDEIFTYSGSLTTPPCSEVVNWHVARKVHSASHDQLQLFRDLVKAMPHSALGGNPPPEPHFRMTQNGRKAVGNARPLQANNGRAVVRRRFYSTE